MFIFIIAIGSHCFWRPRSPPICHLQTREQGKPVVWFSPILKAEWDWGWGSMRVSVLVSVWKPEDQKRQWLRAEDGCLSSDSKFTFSSTFLFCSGPQWVGWCLITLVREMNANSSSVVHSHLGGVFVLCRKLHLWSHFNIDHKKECSSDQWKVGTAFQVDSCTLRYAPSDLLQTHAQLQEGRSMLQVYLGRSKKARSFWWSSTFNSGLKMLQIRLKCQM